MWWHWCGIVHQDIQMKMLASKWVWCFRCFTLVLTCFEKQHVLMLHHAAPITMNQGWRVASNLVWRRNRIFGRPFGWAWCEILLRKKCIQVPLSGAEHGLFGYIVKVPVTISPQHKRLGWCLRSRCLLFATGRAITWDTAQSCEIEFVWGLQQAAFPFSVRWVVIQGLVFIFAPLRPDWSWLAYDWHMIGKWVLVAVACSIWKLATFLFAQEILRMPTRTDTDPSDPFWNIWKCAQSISRSSILSTKLSYLSAHCAFARPFCWTTRFLATHLTRALRCHHGGCGYVWTHYGSVWKIWKWYGSDMKIWWWWYLV